MNIPPAEFDKYVSLVQSMCLDCQMGGITRETWQSNLTTIVAKLAAPELSGSPMVQLFFADDKAREEFIAVVREINPNLVAKNL